MRFEMQFFANRTPTRFMSANAKRTLRRFGNLRYSRLGSLRYVAASSPGTAQLPSARRQHRLPRGAKELRLLQRFARVTAARLR